MGRAVRVLVVDDDVDLRETLQDLLQRQHYRVVAATNGREALALMERERPDVVFLDFTMPVLDGPMTLELMQRGSLRTVPVVLMSGTWGNHSRPAGAAAILDKPFESKTILKLVKRLAPTIV